jgi:hypothetical protein
MLVSTLYVLANLAYFAAATKEEITKSGRLVAALLFRNVWGAWTERVLSGFVALSALGNVLSGVRPVRKLCYEFLSSPTAADVLPGSSQSSIRQGRNYTSE